MHVHNLSAVGEQYLDFEPPDDKPPYAKAGDVIKGDAGQPADERGGAAHPDELAGQLGRRRPSCPRSSARRARCSGAPRTRCSGWSTPAPSSSTQAAANTDSTPSRCSTPASTVLQTQADHEKDIQTFAQRPGRPHRHAAHLRQGHPHAPPGRPARGPGGQLAAQGPRAHAAGLPVQPGHHQPGADHQPPRARADAGRLPARDRGRLHRHAGRRLRPHQPAVQQRRAPVHQGLQAAVPVAPGHRHQRRADLPGPVQVGPAPGDARLPRGTEVRLRRIRPGAIVSRRTMRARERSTPATDSRWSSGTEEGCTRCSGTTRWKWMLTGPVTAGD